MPENFTYEGLVGRAGRNAGYNHHGPPTTWQFAVQRVFGCGSQRAAELCRQFGIDPDRAVVDLGATQDFIA